MKFIIFFISFFISLSCVAQTQISLDSVSGSIGKTVKVCDKVAGTFVTKGEKPVTYLNLGADYPRWSTSVTSILFFRNF